MKILVIEDENTVSSGFNPILSDAGFIVDSALGRPEGMAKAAQDSYALIIVDLILPGHPGLDVVRRLRGQNPTSPILIISANDSVQDRVLGLEAGGDDYLIKPFALAELLARAQALVRRIPVVADPITLTAGDISLDLLKRQAVRQGRKIDLQAREFLLLEYFLRNPGRMVTKKQILQQIWNYDFDPRTNVVDVLVCRLRGKVDKGFSENTIQTVRGLGYIFNSR